MERAAFPPNLPESEQAAYIALTGIYRQFRVGELPQEMAQTFKQQLADWAHCPPMERAAQLQYAFAREYQRGKHGADVLDNLFALFLEFGSLVHQRFVDG